MLSIIFQPSVINDTVACYPCRAPVSAS